MDQTASKENFVQIIDRYQGIINSLCYVYYPNRDDQQDTRQDIILRLWKSFSSFKHESKISTWIYRVSLNTILAKRRKEKKIPQRESLEQVAVAGEIAAHLADDDLQQLKCMINTLKDVDKAIIVLYLEGCEHKEIASILALTPTNISTRMNRIKSKWKEKFKPGHYDLR